MVAWKKTLVSPGITIGDALKCISENEAQVCLVVDDRETLLGIVTDGDIRRALLNAQSLDQPVDSIMNTNPRHASASTPSDELLEMLASSRLRHLPILDSAKRVVGLETIEDLLLTQQREDNWVLLMAGGLGTRLRPFTADLPKPLLQVGDRPLLETIIENFIKQGFRRFLIAVNYKAKMIEEHFGDGNRWNAEIVYLNEERQLGTAGAIGLIPFPLTSSLIVMNGDLLTNVNFTSLLSYHQEYECAATMCVREYDIDVPFGVVEFSQHLVSRINEKPVQRLHVNAGLYVLEPSVVADVPKDRPLDMPDLMNSLLASGEKIAAFPVGELWLDIGRPDDLERARKLITDL